MRRALNTSVRRFLFALALAIVLYLVWQRVRILVWVHMSIWQLLLFILLAAVVLFLILDFVWSRISS